ncbi:putative transcription factor WD40-like family [Helianthus annuus]|nr:putative transcription factor WD40-like family [Helianthus annuus]
MRRVCSLEFRPHLMDSGLADPLLGSPGVSRSASDRSFLLQSTIYNWSYSPFSKPHLTATNGADEFAIKREKRENLTLNHITKCQCNLELRGGDIANNHEYPNKGISKLCLVNELLLVASSDGNVRIWKDDISRGKQKLITAFSSIHGHRPGARSVSVVVDWQQQFGYMVLHSVWCILNINYTTYTCMELWTCDFFHLRVETQ